MKAKGGGKRFARGMKGNGAPTAKALSWKGLAATLVNVAGKGLMWDPDAVYRWDRGVGFADR